MKQLVGAVIYSVTLIIGIDCIVVGFISHNSLVSFIGGGIIGLIGSYTYNKLNSYI